MDLRERLDRELAEPPRSAPDLTETLVAGRQAVRRRRVATGVAGLAAAVAMGGLAWLAAPGDETHVVSEPPSQQVPVDDDPTNDCHEVPATELDACRGPVVGGGRDSEISIYYLPGQGPLRRDPGVRVLETVANPLGVGTFNAAYEVEDNGMRLMVFVGIQGGLSEAAGESTGDLAAWVEKIKDNSEIIGRDGKAEPPASYTSEGVLVIAEGAQVREQIPNPMGFDGEAESVGLAVEHDGQTTWLLLTWEAGSETIASSPAQQGFATLQDWVADMVAQNQGADAHVFVEFDSDGVLRPLDGVEIVEQRSGVDLGSFPPASTVVAHLLVDGERWFVAACECDGAPAYLPVNTPAAGETLDDYIAYHRASNASGEGVR